MKKHLYLVALILILVGKCTFAMETPQKPTNSCIEFAELITKEDYKKWLQQEEVVIWQGIEKVLGINKEKCNQLKEEWKTDYSALVFEMVKNDLINKEISQELLTIIETVLKDFDCPDKLLKIIPFEKRNPAGSTDEILFINEHCLPEPMPKNVKKYLIACAVAMALKKFHSTDFILAQIAHSKGLQDSPEYLQAKQDYQTFKEVSADIEAMLLNNDYIEGQNLYLQRLMDHFGDNADISDWARYHIGKQMAQTLK